MNPLIVRSALAGLVAVAAVAAVWYGSSTRVAIPPPRPLVAAVPAKPAPAAAPTPAPSVAPVPIPVPSPTAAAAASVEVPPMSAAQEAAFNVWLIGAYKQCWSAPKSTPDGEAYLPKIRVAYKADGALAGTPRLVNPPSDPAWRPHADAALRAVKACDPLHVPDKFAAYYRQWKTRTIYFDPTVR